MTHRAKKKVPKEDILQPEAADSDDVMVSRPENVEEQASMPDPALKNSTTSVHDIPPTKENNSDSLPTDDLKGTFVVVTSSNCESVEKEELSSKGGGLEKCLTLAVCRSPLSSYRDNQAEEKVDKLDKIADSTSENMVEVFSIDKGENASEEDKDSTTSAVVPNKSTRIQSDLKVDGDTKQLVKIKTNDKRTGAKNAAGKLYHPVLEVDETEGDNEPAMRINGVGAIHRRASTTSLNPVAGLAEGGRERKQSTVETFPNRSVLSLDGPVKGNRSCRGRAAVQSARTTPINREDNRLAAIITAEWATNGTKQTGNSCNSNRRVHKNDGCHWEQKTNSQRHNAITLSRERSFSRISSENSDKQRPISVFEMRYTKHELRRALPRRSFFSCHDKAMKDAGLETDHPVAKRKAERLKARLEKIANEFCPPSSSREVAKKEINETPVKSNAAINIEHHDVPNNKDIEDVETVMADLAQDQEVNPAETTETTSKHDPAKLSIRPAKKKRPESARSDHIDCRPLIQYLEYVRDNREEYLHHHAHSSSVSLKTKPTSRLISLGKAFELRHMGGIPRHHDDVIIMAAKALRPRSSDPSKYTRHTKDKMSASSAGLHAQDSIRAGRPTYEDKRKQEKSSSHSKDDEHAKTEMERRKIRAEEWTKSVSTNTLTKAKIQSLHELGSDDQELVKWWEAFRDCRYLRDTWPVVEQVS